MKKLSLLVLGKLAEMICGDKPYSYLPYRSSSALTGFFGDLDLNYVHDGSTRRDWVRSVLEELNTRSATTTDLPSQEMIKVIEYLLHPDHFNSTKAHDQDQAIASVNEYLRPYEICVTKSKRTHTVTLHPLYEEFVSSAIEHAKTVEPKAAFDTEAGNAFIAMPMDPDDHTLVDVLEAIKEAAARCSIHAERIDELPSNERITDRMLDSIRRAEYVIVDETVAGILDSIWTGQVMAFILPLPTFFPKGANYVWTG